MTLPSRCLVNVATAGVPGLREPVYLAGAQAELRALAASAGRSRETSAGVAGPAATSWDATRAGLASRPQQA